MGIIYIEQTVKYAMFTEWMWININYFMSYMHIILGFKDVLTERYLIL